MRLLLAMTLGAPLTLPLSVSAQPAEEDGLSSWQVDEGTSLEQPASEEPVLQLKLDEAGVEVAPTEHWPGMGQVTTPEETEKVVRFTRARTGLYYGLGFGAGFLVGGAIWFGVSYICPPEPFCILFCEPPPPCPPPRERNPGARKAGLTLMSIGAAAMIMSGVVYGVRKRQLRNPEHVDRGKRRRVQWDLARSRLVF
jgi:hypothetical protein